MKKPTLDLSTLLTLAVLALAFFADCKMPGATIWLDDLDVSKTIQDWGDPQKNKSVDGHVLGIGSEKFEHGLGTHANSTLYISLNGAAKSFSASVGTDDEVTNSSGSVNFIVLGDGKLLWQSGVMRAGEAAKSFDVKLGGIKTLTLKVGDANDGISYDHADWANAKFNISGAVPETVIAPPEQEVILTPPAPRKSRINGASVFGARPGHPFIFQIPATGDRPMEFSADNLPDGLRLDSQTGLITGTSPVKSGDYEVTLHAKNARGAAEKDFKIVIGDQIALTPPMGWNSWNCFAGAVDDAKVRSAADAMVASGLINHGWTYINIDDTWEGKRDAHGNILSNEKFPDMQALVDYVHAKGLKIGIYSSPGPKTCAGYEGSWQHELQDAQQYAAWGFDYLKYDWCSYNDLAKDHSLPELQKPYYVMHAALDKVSRDIVFSLCQYGMGDVWKWGAQVGGNCWRTTGDIRDIWSSMTSNGFGSAGKEKFAGPGHWNDPDMLVVGRLGWGKLRPTRLTPNEQYTHISLWCLLCSPLLIGCDMSQLDTFTLSLLSNDEVLAVDQDALGRQASRIWQHGDLEIWAKDMEDGSKAVGLFNRGEFPTNLELKFYDLGLSGKHRVRDLWRQKNLGQFSNTFNASVPRHGVVLVRIW
ncbi:MAG TPA: NPCBM/NEW2 domain-containing protein [Verrucomicrobiae bacterium]|nr:NPCBM/NEW2 domain-containing protein [Verrucomicrobiae bacterium]